MIYKQTIDNLGNIEKIDIVEVDLNEKTAHSFAKLYNLQTPVDLRNKISYYVLNMKVQ